MNWFENNPVAVALASFCGLMLLISAVLIFVWNLPVSSGSGDTDQVVSGGGLTAGLTTDLGPIGDYRVVTERPVFDETRRPSVAIEGEGLAMEGAETVADAPDVRLTGVVITPEGRIVSLTPNSGGEPLVFREGLPMEGDYSGWVVSKIDARSVSLESFEGDVIELDLLVHDQKIAAPPEAAPAAATPGKVVDSDAALRAQEDAEPLSRAEEIRQRIAERREELRREQEMNAKPGEETQRSAYQSAIREMISGGNEASKTKQAEDKGGSDDKDG